MKKTVLKYGGAFLSSVIVAVLLLLLAACLPQSRIDGHIVESVDRLVEGHTYPETADLSPASRLDNWSDALILSTSKATSISNPSSVLTNPVYGTTGDSPTYDLLQWVNNPDMEPSWYYPRYWMGFRTIIRLALCLLDYYQIKRYLAILFFTLFIAAVCSISKRVGTKAAMLFAFCVILMRPHVIAISLQYSCCFLIAFLAMLMIPWLLKHPGYEGLFFMELGMITMYFDFYTTPIITFGLPLIYLYLLYHRKSTTLTGKRITMMAIAWLGGYAGMWFAKMALTTAFTSLDGFGNALGSFVWRVGLRKGSGSGEEYSLARALSRLGEALFSDDAGKKIYLTAVICILVGTLLLACHKKVQFSSWIRHKSLIVVGILPIIWLMVAAQPLIIHYFFQYRSIVVTYWALAVYLLLTFDDAKAKIE